MNLIEKEKILCSLIEGELEYGARDVVIGGWNKETVPASQVVITSKSLYEHGIEMRDAAKLLQRYQGDKKIYEYKKQTGVSYPVFVITTSKSMFSGPKSSKAALSFDEVTGTLKLENRQVLIRGEIQIGILKALLITHRDQAQIPEIEIIRSIRTLDEYSKSKPIYHAAKGINDIVRREWNISPLIKVEKGLVRIVE